ncbi:hypothetical protein C8R43DRAFT_907594, partial [Mycena crocata]
MTSTSADRSTSRGREPLTSSGRGGLGNIRPPSTSRDRPLTGPDDFSNTRGREPAVTPSPEPRSTGRGGAGNFRSPSRDTHDAVGEAERIRAAEAARDGLFSTGRGGVGNMAGSRSRSRGPGSPLSSEPLAFNAANTNAQPVHSSGRGGAGNIAPGPPPAYERGRSGQAPVDGVHSTGRGGLANLTSAPAPPPDAVAHHPGAYESTGRGGVGNM